MRRRADPTDRAAQPHRLRILIVITLAEVGGAQTCVAQLLPELAQQHDVTVAAHGPGPLRQAAVEAGASLVELRNVRRRIGIRDALGLVELIRLTRRVRPDIVHAHSSKAGVLGRLAAALCRVPAVVFTAHGWAFKAETGFRSRLYLYADRLTARVTSRVICVSETERREGLAAGTCDARRTIVIRNGVDSEAFAVRSHARTARPRIVSVGRLKAPKDLATLLRALALIREDPFEAVIAGDGPERAMLEALIKDLGLRDAVELVGELDDIPSLLAESDCFVLSSTSEGMPISILEAMAAGLPVVASDVGGVHELVTEGKTGYLVPPGDATALGAALQQVLRDPDLRAELGARARSTVESEFTVSRVQREHATLYQELAAGSTR
jgi:glycosyltransferase involved in cell wall biosynthesis